MIGRFVRAHVRRAAGKQGAACPEALEKIIWDRLPLDLTGSVKIVFLWIMDGGSHTLNAAALPGMVVLNAEWAAELALKEDPDVDAALRMTVGHELTHMEKSFRFLGLDTRERKLVHWVDEIHADFGGIQKAFGGRRADGIRAVRYKRLRKGRRDRACRSHPSWAFRENCIRDYDFGERLIRSVAEEAGCRNERLIRNLLRYYGTVRLHETAPDKAERGDCV